MNTMKAMLLGTVLLASGIALAVPSAGAYTCGATETFNSGQVWATSGKTWAQAYVYARLCDDGTWRSVAYDHASGGSWNHLKLTFSSTCTTCTSVPWSQTDTYVGSSAGSTSGFNTFDARAYVDA